MVKSARLSAITASLLLAVSSLAYADPIKIGVNQPLTGPFAASGTYIVDGAKLAVEEINANGGVLGEQIELVIEDNKSNPTEAAAVAEKLIVSDKVPVMMGAWGSSLTLAAMPKLMQYQVPMLVETSSSSKITKQGNPYVFRISPPSWVEAELFKKYLPQLDIKKVDFLAINNDWGIGTVSDFSEALGKEGIEVGLTEMMDQGAQDLSAQLSKIKASDSDTIIVTTAVEQLTLLLKQAAALGITKKIVTTGGSQNPDQLVDQAGAAANNTQHMVFFAPWVPEKTAHPDQAEAFIAAWEKAGHNKAGLTESYRGYDGIKVITAAIEKAGKAEPEAIKDALWQIEVPALNGTVTFTKDGPEGRESGQYMTNGTLIKIVDGKIELAGS
ncbi:ABC transporter substrate-binding protein [Nitratireductor pacificus]|uniref:Extracellular ligand-binding receptor n=1 Tax=Nitratireductor pacificus pht-3B TaxID=391937 RepID=K2N9U1_9HYPH|nr:ABC transporter substrate-binding protein [Nitratireductor pacificus]EKF20908.1 extracellular ligand-binding receptor [Nitratireductor pacificus pht-3B]